MSKVRIGGREVTTEELREDVKIAYERELAWAFHPSTVQGLLDRIEELEAENRELQQETIRLTYRLNVLPTNY